MLSAFQNETFVDFTNERDAAVMREAIANVESQFGREYPVIIGGKRYTTGDMLASVNPSNYEEVIGLVHKASIELADKAIESATDAFQQWKNVAPEVRARYLLKVASLLRKHKPEFTALIVMEVGKSWAEADGDVAETIDFAEFYAREMIRYSREQPLTPLAGEQNELIYIPLGVGVVIPPWNFPLAILAGMTLASVVAGNTVVLKPSSESPVVSARFVELLEEASLPPGVVNFVPGSGAKIGDYLVGNPRTRFIAFTGSKEVGLHINELAAKTAEGQLWIKRVVSEMGGKDTIVVDETADLDWAVARLAYGAFAYAGQVCISVQRIYVVASIYEEFERRFVERVQQVKVGSPLDPDTDLGPMVDGKAVERTDEWVREALSRGARALTGGQPNGRFYPPTVLVDVPKDARVCGEEVFAPVVNLFPVPDFAAAVRELNDSQFGLQCGVFTNDLERTLTAHDELEVGGVIVNDVPTWRIDPMPYGGVKDSGLGREGLRWSIEDMTEPRLLAFARPI